VRARRKILCVLGTRPEVIKMAPVIRALEEQAEEMECRVVSTAQHREMLDQTLRVFGIVPHVDLDVMRPDQSLAGLTAAVLAGMEPLLRRERPDHVLVQGDTTTALAAALAAFYQRIPVGHVEAGLRSHDPFNPYPEEVNRRAIDAMAELLFAPTARAEANLLREGVPAERILVTGNTVVDALQHVLALPPPVDLEALGAPLPAEARVVLVTSHRRENWDGPLREICGAFTDLVAEFPDVHVVYPVHLNPNVRRTVLAALGGAPRIHLLEPVDYLTLVHLMRRAHLILTDSGGIQEEAPTLGKPVLVLRRVTERPEACEAGVAKVVGTARSAIATEARLLLQDEAAYARMARRENPFGDGKAAGRIVEALRRAPRP